MRGQENFAPLMQLFAGYAVVRVGELTKLSDNSVDKCVFVLMSPKGRNRICSLKKGGVMSSQFRKARIARSHLTYIPAAAELRDLMLKMPGVAKISAGIIKPTGPGQRRVKISDESGGVLLTIRGSTAVQEVHVYTKCPHDVKLALARGARDLDFKVTFKQGVE